jgi:uncharacterized protein with beta-barrel porin domain
MKRLLLSSTALVAIAFTGSAHAACDTGVPTSDGQTINCTPDGAGPVTISDDIGFGTASVTVNVRAGAKLVRTDLTVSDAAINGRGPKWTVNNAGSITSDLTGVSLVDGSVVNNLAGGAISAADVAVSINGNGTLVNAAGATIHGDSVAVSILGVGDVTNAGTIDGGFFGVRMQSGSLKNLAGGVISGGDVAVSVNGNGTLVNAAGATIHGDSVAVRIFGLADVTNAGAIDGGSFGIQMQSGSLKNLAGGVISGGASGVLANSGTIDNATNATVSGGSNGVLLGIGGTVRNAGTITSGGHPTIGAATGAGVFALGAATVVNAETGVITGVFGVDLNAQQLSRDASSSLINAGSIAAGITAVLIRDGGSVTNQAGGTISGGEIGVFMLGSGASTVTNFGTIASPKTAVTFAGGGESTLVNYGRIIGDVQMGFRTATLAIATGSSIVGKVDAGTDFDTHQKKELQLIGGGGDTYDGSFTNFKALTVNAQGGAWTLTGSQSYVDGTSINAGSLFVKDTLTTPQVRVNQGGALGGTGTVTGDVLFNPGSIYYATINGTHAGNLTVSGTADLGTGATLNANVGPGGVAIGQRYTVLTAGSLTNRFASMTTNFSSEFLSSVLSYDAQNVFLQFSRNNVSFASIGGTRNQVAVGRAFDRAGMVSGNPVLGVLLFNSSATARLGFDRASGEGIVGAQSAALHAGAMFSSSIGDQANAWRTGRDGGGNAVVVGGNGALGYAPDDAYASSAAFAKAPAAARFDRTWRVWGSAFGGSSTLQGDASLGTAAQKDSLFGGNIGLDYQVWPNWLVGVAFGGSEGTFAVDSRATSGRVNGVHGAFYSTLALDSFYLSNTTTVSSFGNKTTRGTGGFGGLAAETEHGDFSSWQLRSRFEIGRDLDVAGMRLTPFAAFEIAQLYSNGFTESSFATGSAPGLLGLRVARQTTTSAPLFLGLRGERRFELANGMVLTPQASVAWVHEFSPARNLTGTSVSLPGASFIVDGARPATDAAQVSAGAQLAFTRNAALFASFEGEFSGITQTYGGRGGVRVAW